MATIVEIASTDHSEELEEDRIPTEVLAVITAAAHAFVGRRLRIRGVELQRSPGKSISKWTQQGRKSVQASHNLRSTK